MHEEDNILWYCLIVALIIILLIFLGVHFLNKESLYECYTVDGKKVMCKNVCHTQYQMTGEDFEGTTYQLRSYKEIKE